LAAFIHLTKRILSSPTPRHWWLSSEWFYTSSNISTTLPFKNGSEHLQNCMYVYTHTHTHTHMFNYVKLRN
jgi:hypothetical protein